MTGVYLSRDLHRKLLKLWSPRVSSPGVPKFDWPQRLPLGLIFGAGCEEPGRRGLALNAITVPCYSFILPH
jgi:hypothetical protein